MAIEEAVQEEGFLKGFHSIQYGCQTM